MSSNNNGRRHSKKLKIEVVVCNVINPIDFDGTVGGNATFLWNNTGSILEAKWGLYDRMNDLVTPYFITVSILIPGDGVEFSSDLDGVASRYKNRVHFIGNIAQGHAWFVITNLSLSDTNEYAARIGELGSSSQNFPVKLSVKGSSMASMGNLSTTISSTPMPTTKARVTNDSSMGNLSTTISSTPMPTTKARVTNDSSMGNLSTTSFSTTMPTTKARVINDLARIKETQQDLPESKMAVRHLIYNKILTKWA
ncbi:hypothetical protein QZH41_001756 [Actinostola sp. cb2023]|nr:hypothetical protein QZH41_001756 [Actinostola sp. cb2023]